jgi:hypothetical protein
MGMTGSLTQLRLAGFTMCTRPLEERQDYSGGSRRVFRQFVWLEVDPGKWRCLFPPTGRAAEKTAIYTRII